MSNKSSVSKMISKLSTYIFAFLTVLQCNSVFYDHSKGLVLIPWAFFLIINLAQALLHLYINKINVAPLVKFEIIFLIVSVSYFFIEYLRYPFGIHYILSYVIIPLSLIIIFYDSILIGNEYRIFYAIKNVTFVLSCISLFFWLFSILGIPTNSSIFVTWGGSRYIPGYFGLHFIAQGRFNFLGINTIKNTGIFVETPMYAYVLVISLGILLFFDRKTKINRAQLIVFLITILTTTSTGGIIFSSFIIVYYKLFISDSINDINFKVLFSILLSALFLVGFIYVIKQKFINSDWNTSGSLRVNDFYAGFMSWKDNLLLGNGLANNDPIFQYMNYIRITNNMSGYSIGIMEALSYGGLCIISFYIIPLFLSFNLPKKIFGLSIVSFGLFIIFVVNEVYIYIMIISLIFSFYLLKERKTRSKRS